MRMFEMPRSPVSIRRPSSSPHANAGSDRRNGEADQGSSGTQPLHIFHVSSNSAEEKQKREPTSSSAPENEEGVFSAAQVDGGLSNGNRDANPGKDGSTHRISSSPPPTKKKATSDPRFPLILLALSLLSLTTALEATVLVTSLPAVATAIFPPSTESSTYIFTNTIYLLLSATTQPFLGQLSSLFGRRPLTLTVVALFVIGSGICGGATSGAMLFAGRAVQGMGAGGIGMMAEIVLADLVAVRERGKFIAILLSVYGLGMAAGPLVGGVIVGNDGRRGGMGMGERWRWVFWMNVPVGLVAFAVLFAFLRVRNGGWGSQERPERVGNRWQRRWARAKQICTALRGRIDWGGNALLIASTVAVLLSLSWAGVVYPWASWRVLVPLLLGMGGIVGFVAYEGLPFVKEPVVPLRLLATRTQIILYTTTFLNSLAMMWTYYFVPVYFQAVRLSTPLQSGAQLLVLAVVGVPGSAISALCLARWGHYKVVQAAGFALFALGMGVLGLLDRDSTTVEWVFVVMVPALGTGLLSNILLPAFQASAEESDQAAATAAWSFSRAFGQVWGAAVPATVFNQYASSFAAQHLVGQDSAKARVALQSGSAYASATREFVLLFPSNETQMSIRDVFSLTLSHVFWVAIAFAGAGFLLTLFIQEVPLRTELETEFGLEQREETRDTRQDEPR